MLTGVNTVNLHDERSRTEPVPRRERVRAATEAEILRTAQQLLVQGGTEALTLREVGRQMGMTASALYRYVDGHGDLVDRLTASFYTELGSEPSGPRRSRPRPRRPGCPRRRPSRPA